MGKHLSSFFACLLLVCLLAQTPLWAESDNAAGSTSINKKLIQNLKEELAATLDLESTTQRRRAYKNIVRSSLSLIKKRPNTTATRSFMACWNY